MLAGRRLALSRVHPPPGDGSAPRARLLRMTSSQCTPLVQRCRYTQAWCRAVVGELRRRALSVATSLPAVSSLGGAHERSGSPRRGRAVHFSGGCASSIFCRWLQCHCSATVLRARVAPVAVGVASMTSWSWLASLAPRGGTQEERQRREVARQIWWGRMALYYESAKISMLRAHVC